MKQSKIGGNFTGQWLLKGKISGSADKMTDDPIFVYNALI